MRYIAIKLTKIGMCLVNNFFTFIGNQTCSISMESVFYVLLCLFKALFWLKAPNTPKNLPKVVNINKFSVFLGFWHI